MLEMFFSVFLFISTHTLLDLHSLGSARGEVENWMVVWWRVVSEIFVTKTIKMW